MVGDDFPKKYVQLYRKHGIELGGLQMVPGKTFHWSGEYEANMNNRRTLLTELGVFETFTPALPKGHQGTEFVLLANIAPSLQHHVLDHVDGEQRVVVRLETARGDGGDASQPDEEQRRHRNQQGKSQIP